MGRAIVAEAARCIIASIVLEVSPGLRGRRVVDQCLSGGALRRLGQQGAAAHARAELGHAQTLGPLGRRCGDGMQRRLR